MTAIANVPPQREASNEETSPEKARQATERPLLKQATERPSPKTSYESKEGRACRPLHPKQSTAVVLLSQDKPMLDSAGSAGNAPHRSENNAKPAAGLRNTTDSSSVANHPHSKRKRELNSSGLAQKHQRHRRYHIQDTTNTLHQQISLGNPSSKQMPVWWRCPR